METTKFSSICVRGAALLLGCLPVRAARASDWPFYRHDERGTSDASEPFTLNEAPSLRVKWRFDIPYGIIANPVVAGGTVYVTGTDAYLHAIDAETGMQRWARRSRVTGPFRCFPPTDLYRGPIGAPAVIGSRVFMPGGDGVVYAYDAGSGDILWQTPIADVPTRGEFLWSSAFPVGDRIYVGVASLHDCLLVPGRLVALAQNSGNVVGTWWADAAHGPGGGVWTQQAYDPRTNRIFITTRTVADGISPADQPLAQAFVAIDPISMETLDWFQPVPAPFGEDLDFGGSPVLYDTPDGRHWIAATNKDGNLYALDRDNLAGGVIWQYQVSGYYGDPDAGQSTIVSPAYKDGLVYVGGTRTVDGFSGAMAALDAATGQPVWLVHPTNGGFILAAPTVAGDNVIFAATKTLAQPPPSTLYVLNRLTGQVVFSMDTPGALFSEPTFSNGVLYFGDLDNSVWALARPGPSSFVDDFDRVGPLGPNWSMVRGAFVANGQEALGTAPQSYAFWTGQPAADATVTVTLSRPTASTYIGVTVRGVAPAADGDHYAAFVYPDGLVGLARRRNYDYTYLGKGPLLSPAPHVLGLTAIGINPVMLRVTVDGVEVISSTDSSADALRQAGAAGIFDYNGASQPLRHFTVSP